MGAPASVVTILGERKVRRVVTVDQIIGTAKLRIVPPALVDEQDH
jgi:hypothetical protein